jgi:hypothetical protein
MAAGRVPAIRGATRDCTDRHGSHESAATDGRHKTGRDQAAIRLIQINALRAGTAQSCIIEQKENILW